MVRLSTENARISFEIRWFGFWPVRGWFTDLAGTVLLTAGALEEADVDVTVASASVHTGLALRDRHLRGPMFFDCVHHPSITFHGVTALTGERRDELVLRGVVGIRGVRAPLDIPCTVSHHPNRGGAGSVGSAVVGVATLERRAFGLGAPTGWRRLDPLFMVISKTVRLRIEVSLSTTLR